MTQTTVPQEKTARTPLGAAFGKLWTASIASNLADGLGRTAVPLIATTMTRDPLVLAIIGAISFLPWLIFGLPAGMIVDRVDRRIAMLVANLVRFGAAAGLALAITTDHLSIWLLYLVVLVFGLGETVYDNAGLAMVPDLVAKPQLERANGRMQAAQIAVDSFVATPIAGVLFAIAIAIPMWSTAAGYVVAAGLALMLPVSAARSLRPIDVETGEQVPNFTTRQALHFLVTHRFLRNLTIVTSIVGFLLTFAQAPIILFMLDTLSVPVILIGVVTAVIGAGALLGSLAASPLVDRFGRGAVMFWATLFGGVSMLCVGSATSAWVAIPLYAVGAMGISIWNVPWGAVRQEIIPGPMLGRVLGTIRAFVWGLFPIAGVLGGLVARIDLRLPFIIGGIGIVLTVLIAAPLLFSTTRITAQMRASAEAAL